MKWIDAEQKLEITIFDEQTDDHIIKTMTIEEILDAYTNEGCPEGHSNLENDWNLYSDRPPEKEGRYLVTDDAGGVKTVQDDEFLYREDGTPLWLYSQNVTAWSPLPEPYRGEQDD